MSTGQCRKRARAREKEREREWERERGIALKAKRQHGSIVMESGRVAEPMRNTQKCPKANKLTR